jgi:hypothetical protein
MTTKPALQKILTRYTHVSECKNDKIKIKKRYLKEHYTQKWKINSHENEKRNKFHLKVR